MKIAIASNNGRTVAASPGHAAYFVIINLEHEGDYEIRPNPAPALPHGAAKHQAILELVQDCQVFVAGGMGKPIYRLLSRQGIQVYATDERDIQNVVASLKRGTLTHNPERVHSHHGHHHHHDHEHEHHHAH